jgi:hypothetical protein
MKLPKFGQIVSAISGIWLITMGLNVIVGVAKGLRK